MTSGESRPGAGGAHDRPRAAEPAPTGLRDIDRRGVIDVVEDAARQAGSRPFLSAPDGQRTFGGLARAAGAGARRLRQAGVAPGEPVLLLVPDSACFIEWWLAAIGRGAVPVPLDVRSTRREVTYALGDTGAAHTVVHPACRDLVEDPGGGALPEMVDALALAGASAAGGEAALQPGRGFDCAAVVYTSGTSGPPKGVMVTHAAYVWAGEAVPRWLGLQTLDHLWTALPLHHVNPQAYSFMGALTTRLPLTISAGFHASSFWADAARHGATTTNLVGAMLHHIHGHGRDARDPHRLRLIYAAPAGTPEFRQRFERAYGVRLRTGYGLSECVFGCIEAPGDAPRVDGIGRPRAHPAFDNHLRIVAPDGTELPAGSEGEIVLRNPAVTPGYWNAPELTRQRLRGGWLHTGDLGEQDPDGYVYLRGRLKHMLRRKGENISPWEVEQVLLELGDVREAAVVGVANDAGEQDIHAFVVLAGAVTDETLRAWCARHLAPFKVPDRFHVVDALPRTATERVRRGALVQRLLE